MGVESASILVTDDDPVNRMLLSKLVEREGHRVTEAENGRQACEILASQPIDVVLCDIEMPELDGYGVLERIRQDPRLNGIPVIMISAVDDLESVVRCIDLGADDYMPKPANRTLLRARINASLSRKRLQDLERERVRNLFARFVPEPVVDQVLESAGENLRLGGESRVATVMFSDLRSFTAWAESNPPDRVIEVLNRYLSTMSDVILDHGGTLVSYMGDGIMAVFGAPLEHKHHADLAVAAAQAMVGRRAERVQRLDSRRRAWRRVSDGHRHQHRARDVRQRWLRAAAGVHGGGRHHQHGVSPGADDQGNRAHGVHLGFDPIRVVARIGESGAGRRSHAARPTGSRRRVRAVGHSPSDMKRSLR